MAKELSCYDVMMSESCEGGKGSPRSLARYIPFAGARKQQAAALAAFTTSSEHAMT